MRATGTSMVATALCAAAALFLTALRSSAGQERGASAGGTATYVVRRAGDEDHIRRSGLVELVHDAAELETVEPRKVPVDDGELGRVGREQPAERVVPVARLDHLEAVGGDVGGDPRERGSRLCVSGRYEYLHGPSRRMPAPRTGT